MSDSIYDPSCDQESCTSQEQTFIQIETNLTQQQSALESILAAILGAINDRVNAQQKDLNRVERALYRSIRNRIEEQQTVLDHVSTALFASINSRLTEQQIRLDQMQRVLEVQGQPTPVIQGAIPPSVTNVQQATEYLSNAYAQYLSAVTTFVQQTGQQPPANLVPAVAPAPPIPGVALTPIGTPAVPTPGLLGGAIGGAGSPGPVGLAGAVGGAGVPGAPSETLSIGITIGVPLSPPPLIPLTPSAPAILAPPQSLGTPESLSGQLEQADASERVVDPWLEPLAYRVGGFNRRWRAAAAFYMGQKWADFQLAPTFADAMVAALS